MAGKRTREGRRRRVLCEEVRAHAEYPIDGTTDAVDDDAPRYGEQANIENHPQITDYIPRRRRAVVKIVSGVLLVAAAGQTLAHYAEAAAASVPGITADAVRQQVADGLLAWMAAVVLLMTAATMRVIHSLRRHRVDDQHGRYRVWRWAALAALACSVNAVISGHVVLASAAAESIGWSMTTGAAEWWLAPAALLGVWILSRLMLELAESRSALVLAIAALACYGVAAAGALSCNPEFLADWSDSLTRSLPLIGHALVFGAVLSFARHVVLDVQGLIEHSRKPPAESRTAATAEAAGVDDRTTTREAAATLKAPEEQNGGAAKPHAEWVDGSEPEERDERPSRKLSKAERKRLRKQKMRHRAA